MSFFKKTLLLSSLFLLIFGVIAIIFSLKASPSKNLFSHKQTPEETILNEKIEATSLPSAKIIDSNTYLISEGSRESEFSNPSYIIYYYRDTGEYNITLFKNPLQKTRQEAESAFLQEVARSQITKEESCSLFVNLGTIASVSQTHSGKNYGLSFCPNSKDFE